MLNYFLTNLNEFCQAQPKTHAPGCLISSLLAVRPINFGPNFFHIQKGTQKFLPSSVNFKPYKPNFIQIQRLSKLNTSDLSLVLLSCDQWDFKISRKTDLELHMRFKHWKRKLKLQKISYSCLGRTLIAPVIVTVN